MLPQLSTTAGAWLRAWKADRGNTFLHFSNPVCAWKLVNEKLLTVMAGCIVGSFLFFLTTCSNIIQRTSYYIHMDEALWRSSVILISCKSDMFVNAKVNIPVQMTLPYFAKARGHVIILAQNDITVIGFKDFLFVCLVLIRIISVMEAHLVTTLLHLDPFLESRIWDGSHAVKSFSNRLNSFYFLSYPGDMMSVSLSEIQTHPVQMFCTKRRHGGLTAKWHRANRALVNRLWVIWVWHCVIYV